MNYRNFMTCTLSPLGIPVEHLIYTGAEKTYAVFQRYNLQGTAYSEGKEIATAYYVQLDIFGPSDVTDLADTAQILLTDAGAIRIGGQSMYENDTELYHESRDYMIEEFKKEGIL